MNLICPKCKIELSEHSFNFYICPNKHTKCDLNVGFNLRTNVINLRNFEHDIELILNNYKMPIANLDIIILQNKISIDYKPSENPQEILFDLFKMLLKHEENLIFL